MRKTTTNRVHPIKLLLWLFVSQFALSTPAWAQNRVTGTVISAEDKQPLPGVSIMIKGLTTGTTTDVDGKFSLNVEPGAVLQFSYIGYLSQEVKVGTQTVLNIVLQTDMEQLEEIVVIGYGVQRKSDLTGSMTSLSAREVKQVAVTSLDQAMQGRAAGVQVTQASAAPGGGVSVRIRGGNSIQASNEPLYVIDGIPIFPDNATFSPGTNGGGQAQNALANLNPGDIESIEILKDASATAIYGSRGANGVVLITTKRGKAGATRIDWESYYGVQEVKRRLPLLNAEEFATIANEARANSSRPPMFTQEQIAGFRNNSTDWQSEIFRPAPIQNHQLTISGGNEGTRFALSANLFEQQGVILNSGFRRASLRLNLDKDVNKKLTIGTSIQLSRATNNQQVTEISRGGVVNAAMVFSPTLPVFDANGMYILDNTAVPGSQPVGNPVQDAFETLNSNITNRVLGNTYAEWNIMEGLKLRGSVGLDLQTGRRDFYAPSTNDRGRNSRGSGAVEKKDIFTPVGTLTLTYNKKIREAHALTLLAGYESQSQMVDFLAASSSNFPTDAVGSDNLALGQVIGTPVTGRSLWRLDSWFGRVNYSFKGKYLLTATLRADGSSRFGAGNKWGYFPSAAVGYNLAEEEFVKSLGVFSNLKVTASWGLTGNQEIGQYQSLSQLSTVRYPFGTNIVIGQAPGRVPNPDLRWEKTNQFNAGLDMGFLQDRITVELATYLKRTQDLLLNLDLPRTTGFSTVLQNIGSVENRGVELTISSNNLTGAFTWTTSGNITFNRNEVIALGPGETFRLAPGTGDAHLQIGNSGILRIGEPVGSFFGMRTDGIYQTGDEVIPGSSSFGSVGPGDIRYVDTNGDGRVDNNDRVIIGNPHPDFFFGLSNKFAYKNFDLLIFLQGTYGNDVWNANSHELYRNDGTTNNVRDVMNRWRPDAPDNYWPSARTRPFVLSDRHIEDASFLRVRTVTLGYQLPVGTLPATQWLRSLRVYLQGQNLFTLTNYSGFDPEVNALGQSPIGLGIDRGSYPMARMFIMGINIGL